MGATADPASGARSIGEARRRVCFIGVLVRNERAV